MAFQNAVLSPIAGTTVGPNDFDALAVTTAALNSKAVTQPKMGDEAVYPMNVGLACRNETSGTLSVGTLVYVSGWNETQVLPLLSKADADAAGARATWIVVTAMSDSTNGVVGKQYRLTGVDTHLGSVADPVYLDTTAGGWTLTAPTGASAVVQIVGRIAVSHASAGEIEFDLEAHAGFKSIGTNELATGAVTSAKITDGTIVGADCSTVMATKSCFITIGTKATTGASEVLIPCPHAGTLIGAKLLAKDALTANDTNYLTFALTNKGQSGAGSTAMLSATASGTTQATGGAGIAAYTTRDMPLHATGGNATVAANDALVFTATATGTLANTVTEIVIRLDFQVAT
jgi:hypothetical protein